jgi:hypothetical protein
VLEELARRIEAWNAKDDADAEVRARQAEGCPVENAHGL